MSTSAVFDDRYHIGDLLGRGGMADVYRAHDELLNRDVAIKVLREVEEPTLRARFIAEARLLASLNHPGLVTLLDAGIRADRPYLVMTLAEGPTLAAQIASAPLQPRLAAEIGTQLADALAYAHERGVVHRDVKPSNVLLCDGSRALLADFGIARLTGGLEQYTRTGETIASAAYLSPEQAAGEEITAAADIYSLGLVLLESMTGQRAFPGTPTESAVRRLTTPVPIPTSLPRPWRDLLATMTARDPAARPSGAEVAAQLTAIAAGTTGPAVVDDDLADTAARTSPLALVEAPESDPTPTQRWVTPARRPRRVWLWRAAAATAVVAVAAVLAVVLLHGTSQPPRSAHGVPSGVPSRFHAPLQKLQQAIDGATR